MIKQQIIKNLMDNCTSFRVEKLTKLTYAQLNEIEATDCNWCEQDWEKEGFDSPEEATSRALFAQYEEIIENMNREA